MKLFLTIYICSVVSQQCAMVPMEKHDYDRFYDTHYGCMQKGLGESYEILFSNGLFTADEVESLQLYPKWTWEKTDNVEKPEA